MRILGIVVIGLLLRIYVSSDPYLHSWDERYHALVAKNMVSHITPPQLYSNPILDYDYKNWQANHIWLHKPPLTMVCIASSLYIFGINTIAVRLPSLIFSGLTIFLTFLIGRSLFNRNIGLWAAFLFAINGFLIEAASGRIATDHVDTLLIFLITLGIYLVIISKKRNKWYTHSLIGMVMGLALLTKSFPALIILPAWLYVHFNSKNKGSSFWYFCCLIIPVLIFYIPWQLYIHHEYPLEAAWEQKVGLLHFTQVIEGHVGDWFYYLHKMRIFFGEIVYLPVIFFVWKTFKLKSSFSHILLMIWITLPYLVFTLAKTKMPGYVMIAAPAMFIVIGVFIEKLRTTNFRYEWMRYLILFLLIALPIRYCIERVKPFQKSDYPTQWIQNIKELDEENTEKEKVLFNFQYNIEAMFHSDFVAYPHVPEDHIIESLMEEGYSIYLHSEENECTDLKIKEGIKCVNLFKIRNQ